MADPLSVSASVAGLITIADAVFSRTFKYVKAVKGAPKELSALTLAMGALSGVLHNLNLVILQLEGEPFDTTIQANHIYSCLQTVEKVRKVLDNFESSTGGHSMKLTKRLRWPFSVSEAKDLCKEIEGHKATLNLALTADGLSGLLQSLSRQKELQNGINGIQSELQQRREIETRIAVTEDRRKILDWIQPYDPRQNHQMSLRLRHPGTGLWLIESDEFRTWLSCSRAKLWCYGIPGAGKTVLASSVIQEVLGRSSSNIAVAFFYCDYRNAATQDPRNILGSLGCQFALQDEQSFGKLRAFYEKHNPANQPSIDFSMEGLSDLLIEMASNFNDAMIVVDALDECGTQNKLVTRLLSGLNDNSATGNIKTLFLSRDELEIRESLEGYDQVSIAARSSDLRLFVAAEIELRTRNKDLRIKDELLKQEIMERLVQGADGMFRWVACQMDHLCDLPNDAARRKALNTLPPTLHATYERILQRVNKRSKEVQQLVQRSLRWLVCSKLPLRSSALCEAISIETGDRDLDRTRISDEDEILRWCSSLVRKSTLGDGLELAHFTVKEFLTTGTDPRDREFGAYHFCPDIDDAELAERCLTYLLFTQYENEGGIESPWQQYSFRQYAVHQWPDHARKNLSKPAVLSLTQELLHPSKQHIFISWAQELRLIVYGRAFRGDEKAWLSTASPLHFACMLALSECCEWLLQKGCCINQSSAFGTPLECALLGDAALAGHDLIRMPVEPPSAELGESRLATVKLLISSGADVHRNSLGQPSPMLIALYMNDRVSCIELLRKGALIDSDTAKEISKGRYHELAREIWEGIDTSSLRPEDCAVLLEAALRSERFSKDGSFSVLAHKFKDVAATHLNPFLTAAEYGQLDVIERIAQDHRFDINATRHQDQRSALHLAASNDHIDIVKFLLEHGADCTLGDSQGRTPLHTSVEKSNRCRCLQLLVGRKVDVNCGDKDGLTAWHLAASEGNIPALSILRGFVADGQLQLHLKANDGRTILHCAAQSSSKEILVFLMDHYNQSAIHDTTLEGFTALHYAVKAKSLYAVEYLVDREFDTHAISNDGSSTLHCAVDQDSKAVYEIIEFLLKRGVDPCKVRKDGMTPIHLLLSTGPQTLKNPFIKLIEFETILRGLTQKATSLDSTNGAGLSALHQVCQLGEDPVYVWRRTAIPILLQNGADPTLQDNVGKTALMYLVEFWKKSFPTSRSVSYLCTTMIEEILGSSNDENFLSLVCADPQILCLALISRNERLTYKVLEYHPSVDARAFEVSGWSSLETACLYGCSRLLLEELLRRSKVDRGTAGSKSGLLVLACSTRPRINMIIVTDLLDLGFDPNDQTVEGKSALMLAVEVGDLAVAEILIHHGADVSAKDDNGWSVIHYACQSGSKKQLDSLKRVTVDWNASITIKLVDEWSYNATALHLAARHDSYALEFLLKNDLVGDVNSLTDNKETALWIAAFFGNSRNVSLLLDRNADDTIRAFELEPPLHAAIRYGSMEAVMIFIDRGCNLLLQDGSGFTPELAARKYGYPDIANMLKEKTSAAVLASRHAMGKEKTRSASEALKMAIELGDMEFCQALVEEGVNTDSGFPDRAGDTPVLCALGLGQLGLAEYLIANGASVAGAAGDRSYCRGYTPFHYAASAGNLQILRLLFEKAPREMLRSCQSVHPIHLAIASGHAACVDLIIDHSRRVQETMVTDHVCEGSYDLKHVIEISISESGSLWPMSPTSETTFSQLDLTTTRPLHIAAAFGHIEITRSLIEHGAAVDGVDDQLRTPLHFAAKYGQTQVIEVLVHSSANVNALDTHLESPCMLAASYGFLEAIQALIEGGADLTIRDRKCRTALYHAADSAHSDIFIFLITNTKSYMLNAETTCGESVLSTILSWIHPSYSSFILNLAPDPSVYEPGQSNVLTVVAVTNNPADLKMLLRRLPKALIPSLLAHRALVRGTPLYAAATRPSEKVIDMLLDAGADLELEGGAHGTPLMGACAAGRLEVVKTLILKGAMTSYTKDGQIFSALSAARLYPKVTRWLLVGRFMEGPLLIENGTKPSEGFGDGKVA